MTHKKSSTPLKRRVRHAHDITGLSKEEVVIKYLPLVKYLAKKTVSRLPHNIEINDLISVGMMGLMKAVENFDPSQGFQFNTFAEHRIRGAMIDELRRQDWMPRSVRNHEKKLANATRKIEQTTGKKASNQDIARHLGVSEADVAEMKTRSITMVKTYDDMSKVDREDNVYVVDFSVGHQMACNPCSVTIEKNRNEMLKEVIASLPEKQADVLSLYYFEELNLREIGVRLNLTESRVSQIHSQAIKALQEEMAQREDDFSLNAA